MSAFDALCANESELLKLRTAIREFLAADSAEFGWRPVVDSWLSSWDEAFSARLGAAGFIGLTIPTEYGGHGLGHLHRYVVTEELLAYGAPVAAHWMVDRQFAPALLSYGSRQQRQEILPKIAAGRFYASIGMSEHGSGSDLAAASTKAAATDGGWILNGTKVWTSGAHHADLIVVFAVTAPLDPEHRHAGFTQFLVPTNAPGVTISPVLLMSGEHHFNEVILDDVFVPDVDVLGEVGDGWRQVTAELSFERSGPERILTTAPLILAAIRALSSLEAPDDRLSAEVGDLLAQLISLRLLSVSVARVLTAGESATNHAALVKDLGTIFEQGTVERIADLLQYAPAETKADPVVAELLTTARLHKPVFTLRGGTNEVLRGVVARGMGLR
jgi:acyl-CoA dehydrogenase